RVTITAGLGWAIALPVRQAMGWDPVIGAAGLTATAGMAGWIEFLLLKRALGRRIGGVPLGGEMLVRTWAAALLGVQPAFLLHRLGGGGRGPVVEGVLILGLFGAGYLVAARLLGLAQARALLGRI